MRTHARMRACAAARLNSFFQAEESQEDGREERMTKPYHDKVQKMVPRGSDLLEVARCCSLCSCARDVEPNRLNGLICLNSIRGSRRRSRRRSTGCRSSLSLPPCNKTVFLLCCALHLQPQQHGPSLTPPPAPGASCRASSRTMWLTI